MRFRGILNLDKKSSIIPTHVGVNRIENKLIFELKNYPHTRGGEPI